MSKFALFVYPKGVRKATTLGYRNRQCTAVHRIEYKYRYVRVARIAYGHRVVAAARVTYSVAVKLRRVSRVMYAISVVHKSATAYPVTYGYVPRKATRVTYDPATVCRTALRATYGSASRLVCFYRTTYGRVVRLACSFPITYGYSPAVRSSTALWYGSASLVKQCLAVAYDLRHTVLASTPVEYAGIAGYRVLARTGVRYSSMPYSLVTTINDVPTVSIGGVMSTILSGEVFIDEGEGVWRGSLVVSGMATYLAATLGEAVQVAIGPDTYLMFVDSRSLRMSGPASTDTEISLVSAGASLSEPRATPSDITIAADTTARAFAEVLAGTIGIDWLLLDWGLPAGVEEWKAAVPMTVIKELVTAAGGVVDALPSGRLVARAKYPVSPVNYQTCPVVTTVHSVVSALTLSEEHTTPALYGTFRIMDTPAELSDRLEYKSNEEDTTELTGRIFAYPYPYRTSVELVHTSNADIMLGAGRWEYREEEQEIEVVGGEAGTSYPVVSILSATWNDDTAGNVDVAYYGTRIRVSGGTGYGLLKLRYRTLALVYDVRSVAADTSQFLLQEV